MCRRMRKLKPEQAASADSAAESPSLTEMRVFAERLLARREYAVAELQARLLSKWPGSDLIGERVAGLITSLRSEGVLSNERFAESFIRSRQQKFQGPLKIQAELRQRRVPENIISALLEPESAEWKSLAANWLSRQYSGPMDYGARAKYYRRLTNRGFSHQQAMDAVSARKSS